MSKQEKLTWLTFVVVTVASGWLAWLLWTTWPNTEVFALQEEDVGRYLALMVFLVLCVTAAAQAKWRPKEPFADERDLDIMYAGNTQGFAALALMNVVLGVLVIIDDGLLARLAPEWVRYLLLLQVGIAIAIGWGYRIVRYRRG